MTLPILTFVYILNIGNIIGPSQPNSRQKNVPRSVRTKSNSRQKLNRGSHTSVWLALNDAFCGEINSDKFSCINSSLS